MKRDRFNYYFKKHALCRTDARVPIIQEVIACYKTGCCIYGPNFAVSPDPVRLVTPGFTFTPEHIVKHVYKPIGSTLQLIVKVGGDYRGTAHMAFALPPMM